MNQNISELFFGIFTWLAVSSSLMIMVINALRRLRHTLANNVIASKSLPFPKKLTAFGNVVLHCQPSCSSSCVTSRLLSWLYHSVCTSVVTEMLIHDIRWCFRSVLSSDCRCCMSNPTSPIDCLRWTFCSVLVRIQNAVSPYFSYVEVLAVKSCDSSESLISR